MDTQKYYQAPDAPKIIKHFYDGKTINLIVREKHIIDEKLIINVGDKCKLVTVNDLSSSYFDEDYQRTIHKTEYDVWMQYDKFCIKYDSHALILFNFDHNKKL